MRVWAIEHRFDVATNRKWRLWSGTHFYKTPYEADKALKKLDHKLHPISGEFRVKEYGPRSGE